MSARATYAVGLLAVPIAVPIIFLLVFGGQAASSSAATCGPPAASANDIGDPELDGEQMQVAQQIVGRRTSLPSDR